jgi:hypothetical protein
LEVSKTSKKPFSKPQIGGSLKPNIYVFKAFHKLKARLGLKKKKTLNFHAN